MIRSLRGMNDIIDEKRFEYFLTIATQIAKNYGFTYIETPLLEETALFKRSVGESSDIVGKEMYQFTDKGDNDVCLRPEGTAGVVRAFIQNKFDRAGAKQRFFYYGPMFRYERPQKGRLREFHQFGVESFGESDVYEDATMIMMIDEILQKLGIQYQLKINSLGDQNCMPAYRQKLVSFLTDVQEDICEDCKRRMATNPIRVLDCKNEKCQKIYVDAPKLLNNLCPTCKEDFEKLQSLLHGNGIEFTVDANLVRGLDYYSKSAFEFVSDDIGAQSAIAGGGRYDRLVEFLDGKPTPAIGFAIGIERLLELIAMPTEEREGWYFGALDAEVLPTLFTLATKKRKDEKTLLSYDAKSLKAHLKAADKEKIKYCAIIGENEQKNGTIWIKDLDKQSEQVLSIKEI
jgi:histidyl-tRNA synthetase